MDFTASTAMVHAGFIAQEVEQAAQSVGFISSIVHAPANNSDPYKLSYAEIVVPLVKALQELSKTTDSLKIVTTKQDSINKGLQAQIDRIVNRCCPAPSGEQTPGNNGNGVSKTMGSINIELSDNNAIVLNQNAPNPFAEQTTISYSIPANATSAQILFYDTNGLMIKNVAITTTGLGQINVYANDLSNGIYSYTLIVDGKIIATKKMVKQQ
jgi:hypothetical protein